jgi:class 3 adenylate cyclase/tetratricopeptide (TPR) repeat protein
MDVADWLRRLGLHRYEAAFRGNDVSAALLPSLTAADLRDLGITSIGHRRLLLDALAALRAERMAAGETDQFSQLQPNRRMADGVSSGSMPERRQLSVMFCDVAGFTTLSSRLDPEDLSVVIRGYQACVAKTIARFQGFIARYVGDGVLIYFGWPEAGEADAERAVRAALAVIAEIGRAPIGQEKLQIRIGIATGLAVVGESFGAGDAHQHMAIGATPNRAARLQGLADADGIVIDDATRRQIGGLFDCIDIGSVGLKGLSEPVHTWQVLKEAHVDSRFEALHATASLTPLIGRGEELDLLMRCWAQAKAGTGRGVMISGEPGIGKSRLVAELGERLHGEDYTRLRYFCSPHHGNSPLYPIIRQLTYAAGFDYTDADPTKWAKLRTHLGSTGTDEKDIALLGDLLALSSDDVSVSRFSSQAQKERTFGALLRQIGHLCRERALLMLFEDVHWADPTTRELLDLIIGCLTDMRVLLLMTLRPDFRAPLTRHASVTSMTLSRLSRKEGVQLAGLLTTTLPPALLDRIAAQADGVPLFIEELTKAVVEGAVDTTATPPMLGVPTTLQGSLLARLDRLPDAKQAAQIGAVLGREFSYQLVSAVTDLPEPVLAKGLAQLVSSGLAHSRGQPPSATYRFKHALVQEVAYSTLLRTHRQRTHSRIADVLSARREVTPQLLAHHLTEAGRTREAIDYWFEAGQRVAGRSAEREAIGLYRRGLSLLLTLPESGERDRRELEFQMALGMPLVAIEGYHTDLVLSGYQRVQELGNRLGDMQAVLLATYGTFVSSVARGDNQAAASISLRTSAQFAGQDDPTCHLILHRMAALAAFQAGDFRSARRGMEAVLELYDPAIHAPLAGRCGHDAQTSALNYLTHILWLLGFPDQAYRLMEQAFEASQHIRHSGSMAQVHCYAGVMFADLRRDPAALRYHVAATTAFLREHGLLGIFRTRLPFFEGMSLFACGMPAKGLALAEQSPARMSHAGGERHTYVLARLAEAWAQAGQLDRAWQTITEAQSMSERTAEHSWATELQRIAGEILLAKGADAGEVEPRFRLAIETARRQAAKSLELRAALGLARLLIGQGRKTEARDLLTPIYTWFTEGFETADLREAGAVLGELGVEPTAISPAHARFGPPREWRRYAARSVVTRRAFAASTSRSSFRI